MFSGSLGQPEGGWPPKIQEIVLRGKKPREGRPGDHIPPADLDKAAATVRERFDTESRTDLMSYLMYPDVFAKFARARTEFGELEVLPTSQFLYGLQQRDEVTVDLEPGKSIVIRLLTVDEPKEDGMRTVFFELNGQGRDIEVRDKSIQQTVSTRRKADATVPGEVPAPIPGAVTTIHVKLDSEVKKGEGLLVMEAMKMQTTVHAPVSGRVKEILVSPRESVSAGDLLLIIE
jgi:pyruvate carboxylase